MDFALFAHLNFEMNYKHIFVGLAPALYSGKDTLYFYPDVKVVEDFNNEFIVIECSDVILDKELYNSFFAVPGTTDGSYDKIYFWAQYDTASNKWWIGNKTDNKYKDLVEYLKENNKDRYNYLMTKVLGATI